MPIANLTIRKEPHYRRAAFESGLKRIGYSLSSKQRPNDRRDLLITWNLKRGSEEDNAKLWEQQGGSVLVVENGYLQKEDKTYYTLSLHGHNGSGWFPVGSENRFNRLGFPLKPIQPNSRGHWVVCGQRGIGSSLMASPPRWAEKAERNLRSASIPTKLRMHPGNAAPKIPLVQDLEGAAGCFIWSSAAGVRALVEGYSVVFNAPHWVCGYPWWKEKLPTKPMQEDERTYALHKMSHGQWHHEEIATGEPLDRMIRSLGDAIW